MKSSALLRVIWVLGGLALILGFGRDAILGLMPKPRELPRADGATGMPWVTGEFVDPINQDLAAGLLPSNVAKVSSWVGTDEAQGRSETTWFKARRKVHVAIAGYPQLAGCKIWAEFRAADGRVTRLDCPLVDPREEWAVWEIARPPDAVALRIIGEDRTSAYTGWVAFSHPFRAGPAVVKASYQALQILTTTALALTLIFGPGLFWFRRARSNETHLVQFLAAGPLTLALTGLVVWCSSGVMRPQYVGTASVLGLWISVGARAWRWRFTPNVSNAMLRVLGVTTLVAVAVIAKSSYSVGPPGELYRGLVSRNMEMSDRIDSRFSFYVVQAAAHHWGPASTQTEKFFAPWTFFSRGPLAGLLSTPVVMATNGRPPTTLPEDRWSPFDPTGFMAYRITVIVLSSSIILALFMVLVPLIGERWALIASGLLALTPFGVHEVMFTWPKWAATSWLLASFGLAHARRPLGAGIALATGFLFHPLPLLWAPWVGLWAAGRSERRWRPVSGTLLRFGAGAGALVIPWMALGSLMPHLPNTPLPGQTGFLRYWVLADWHTATWSSWCRTRWMNFANTFLPLHLYLDHASFNHPKLGSAYEKSGTLVKLAEMWWTSLPFGMGLGLWAISLVAMVKAVRSFTAAVILFVIAPAIFITAYWGMDPLGLMRECGHPLLIAIVAITCAFAARHDGMLRAILSHRAVPWLQLPETWLMLWLTTLLNSKPWPVAFAQLDVLYFVISTLALAGAAYVARLPANSNRAAPLPNVHPEFT